MSSIQQLANLLGSDPGFYVLALHSYMEDYLKSNSPISYIDYDFHTFEINMEKLGEYLSLQLNALDPDLNCFKAIARDHKMAIQVRDNSTKLTSAEATQATFRFLQFCKLLEIDDEQSIIELEKSLKRWNTRSEENSEMRELLLSNEQLLTHIKNEKGFHQSFNNWQKDLKKYNDLQKELQLLDSRINSNVEKRDLIKKMIDDQKKLLESYGSIGNYSHNLKRIIANTRTRVDYERSIIRLSQEQKEILDLVRLDCDFLISGAAGTGKTYLLLEIMRKAIIERRESLWSEGQFVLLSYTRTLVKYNRYISKIMNLNTDHHDLIGTVDSYMNSLFSHLSFGHIDYGIQKELCSQYNDQKIFLKDKFLLCEIEDFIYWYGLDKEQYLSNDSLREVLDIKLSPQEKEQVWTIKEQMEKDMLKRKFFSKGFALSLLAESINEFKIDTFFIDEVQDLSPQELKILKSIARRGLIMSGDLGQRIYGINSPFYNTKIILEKHQHSLNTNFRSTLAIHNLAEKFRNHQDFSVCKAYREGPTPELFTANETEQLYGLLINRVHFLIDVLEYDPGNIFILVSNSNMEKKVSRMVYESGYSTVNVKDDSFDFYNSKNLRLSTLHSSKGLDMPVVLLFLPKLFSQNKEGLHDDTREQLVRNLLYVSMTRAMDILNIFIKKDPQSIILDDLKRVFDEKK